jgi:hypothetical protein
MKPGENGLNKWTDIHVTLVYFSSVYKLLLQCL